MLRRKPLCNPARPQLPRFPYPPVRLHLPVYREPPSKSPSRLGGGPFNHFRTHCAQVVEVFLAHCPPNCWVTKSSHEQFSTLSLTEMQRRNYRLCQLPKSKKKFKTHRRNHPESRIFSKTIEGFQDDLCARIIVGINYHKIQPGIFQ